MSCASSADSSPAVETSLLLARRRRLAKAWRVRSASGSHRVRQPLAAPPVLNQTWALDFMNDEGNRERLEIAMGTSLPGGRVIRVLNELVAWTAVSLLMRCLLDKVAEQILFDLWRADFPNTTIDEVVMNIDEGQENHGTKR